MEMFPRKWQRPCSSLHLLHACGDVSASDYRGNLGAISAPRMWRCFPEEVVSSLEIPICSTHVEMFPLSLFHAKLLRRSAPRMWRCFLRRQTRQWPQGNLLHACGDVSDESGLTGICKESAPRMWRCFQEKIFDKKENLICSTHVEMFPSCPS